MNLNKSKTYLNLAKSYNFECITSNKYYLLSQLSLNEGYTALSKKIDEITQNEQKHAQVFYNLLVTCGGIIPIDMQITFIGNDILEGLKQGFLGEEKEQNAYEEFSKIASSEGFLDIAKTFSLIAEVEKSHYNFFKETYEKFSSNLYSSQKEKTFICSQCGYSQTGLEPWSICPLCSSNQGFVKI